MSPGGFAWVRYSALHVSMHLLCPCVYSFGSVAMYVYLFLSIAYSRILIDHVYLGSLP